VAELAQLRAQELRPVGQRSDAPFSLEPLVHVAQDEPRIPKRVTLFEIFAGRAAAELRRLRAERALHEREAQLTGLLSRRGDAVAVRPAGRASRDAGSCMKTPGAAGSGGRAALAGARRRAP
jgi:hypothetical protein